ncbi:hypothetical protein DMI70_25790 [Escherichia coli]|nr:hypothetical protein [Escherichia coli]
MREAVALPRTRFIGGLASRHRCICWKKVLTMFDLRDGFDALASAEKLPLQQAASASISRLRSKTGGLTSDLRGTGRFGKWRSPLKQPACVPSSFLRQKRKMIHVLP